MRSLWVLGIAIILVLLPLQGQAAGVAQKFPIACTFLAAGPNAVAPYTGTILNRVALAHKGKKYDFLRDSMPIDVLDELDQVKVEVDINDRSKFKQDPVSKKYVYYLVLGVYAQTGLMTEEWITSKAMKLFTKENVGGSVARLTPPQSLIDKFKATIKENGKRKVATHIFKRSVTIYADDPPTTKEPKKLFEVETFHVKEGGPSFTF